MKNFLIAVVLITLFGCSSINLSITKRHYRPGYNVELSSKLKVQSSKLKALKMDDDTLKIISSPAPILLASNSENLSPEMLSSASENKLSKLKENSKKYQKRLCPSERSEESVLTRCFVSLSKTTKTLIFRDAFKENIKSFYGDTTKTAQNITANNNPPAQEKQLEIVSLISFILLMIFFIICGGFIFASFLIPSAIFGYLYLSLPLLIILSFILSLVGRYRIKMNKDNFKGEAFSSISLLITSMILLISFFYIISIFLQNKISY